MSTSRPTHPLGSSWLSRLTTLATLALLLLTLVISTGEMVHGQLLKVGEMVFNDPAHQVQYFLLRADPEKPACDPTVNVDREIARQAAAAASGATTSPKPDDLDDLLGAKTFDEAATRASLSATVQNCIERHALHNSLVAHITPQLKAFRALETSFFGLFQFGSDNRPLILLLLMGVTILATTVGYHHISLVAPRHPRDFKVQAWTMLAASSLSMWSAVRYYQISGDSGVPIEDPHIHFGWMLMFGSLMLVSAWQTLRPHRPDNSQQLGEGSWLNALKAVPLAGLMTLSSAHYFFSTDHPSGLAIYTNALMEFPNLPLQLALFIWGGMLFKQSRMVDVFMNLLRPWKLSPEALTYIILLAAAIPTAYTGGSGAFVMAAGAITYHEIRAVGGSSQYALAATAMSGSLGVVLRPSLLVVAIVAVNKEVTSDELFHWGLYVFFLTSTLFFVASQMRRERHTIEVAPARQALPAMLRQVPTLLPYIAVVAAVIAFYDGVLDASLNEITAPIIMPVMMIFIVVFDKLLLARGFGPKSEHLAFAMHREKGVRSSLGVATVETVEHLGGYMFLILLSQAAGGVIERSGIIHLAPDVFDSAWTAMTFMSISLVVLGMFMEPLGAIFLVSGTLAPLAYKSGIDPVHFWVMVLVAFELGYLMPPVALNQLLARQVVGDDLMAAADKEVASQSFYRRYERWILPCAVMTLGLVIVSFAPLAVTSVPELQAWFKGWMLPSQP
ncbi:TRAP-type C4-dicarboxylate transport system permease large subunit [Aquabacterium commune]|uniref:TRAP-type C4-dicarboxylate transport system permease large subunit n=1 Tax=Aquabacterium commune TaxID=70586 RepID=A0A4R6RQF3_9BURK|nr:TRAP transporter large permease subunit [Aquabacterium commune]TDP88485.1 TRAP-type C4-dicarboxylate transport system permease large subunit [Aquabacterium commune]